MIERIEQVLHDVDAFNTKLVLLVGPQGSGKTQLLGHLAGAFTM